MNKFRSGFTMVEILVVIAVIGILATVTFMGFGRYQADTRDSTRADKATILAEALEKYYDQNGEYPSCSAITAAASTVTTSTLSGVDPNVLLTPSSSTGTTNSIQCSDVIASSSDIFGYVGDGSSNCTSGTGATAACLQWTLKYKQEGTGTIISIQSRRRTAIVTSGQSTVSALPSSFTQIDVSWLSVPNAISYQLQRATDAGFTANIVNTTVSSLTSSATGLAYNTTYYFRVMANATSSQGSWSSAVSATTWSLSTPVFTYINSTSTTSFYANWNAVSHAASYTIQLSSDGTSWSTGWQYAGITPATYTWGGATPGWRYFARMQAINGAYTSPWSTTVVTALPIDTPSVGATVNSSTTFTSSWGGIAGAQSYNVQCSSDNATWGSGCQGSTTGTSFGWGPTWQGRPLYFRTQAVGEYTTGAWSGSVGATTWIDTPAAPTYQGPGSFKTSRGGAYYYYVVNYASYCPGGTTLEGATFHTMAWGQNFGPHPFGFNDWWETYGGAQAGSVQYWGHYYCDTPWASSPWSPESYDVPTTYL